MTLMALGTTLIAGAHLGIKVECFDRGFSFWAGSDDNLEVSAVMRATILLSLLTSPEATTVQKT